MHGSAAPHTYTEEDLALIEQIAIAEARAHFWCYRQYINQKLILGWWQREVASQLMKFYWEWRAGFKPKLVICSPPQHGKSRQITDFISWVSGRHPDCSTIYASYSEKLSLRENLWLQRIFDNPKFTAAFPQCRLVERGTKASNYRRNFDILEFVGRLGSFRNTTVLGQVTGETIDGLGVIDDPLKGRAEANSPTIREKTWSWVTDDFLTRFSEDAALLMIVTRWHLDDPVGRLQERFPDLRILRYPALAEHNEPHRKIGEPLFPQLKSKAFLMERKAVMSLSGFESVYQQNPILVGGGLFPIDKFNLVRARPGKSLIKRSVRYWDKAGTQDGGAYTAGVLMEELKDGRFCVSDVKHGQWSALQREAIIKQTADLDNLGDPTRVEIFVEQEPGSGGKESAEATVRQLRGYIVKADRVSGQGSKELRAEPYGAQVQGGNVDVLMADWTQGFIDEHEVFPAGKYKDQVDAASGAFNKLAGVVYGEAAFGTYGTVGLGYHG